MSKRTTRSTPTSLRDMWRTAAAEAIRSNAAIVIGFLQETSTEEQAIRDYHEMLCALGEEPS